MTIRGLAALLGYDLRRADKSDSLDTNLRRFFANHPVGLVIDCGAFIGRFAKLCRRSGYAGPILSFEPSSKQYAALAEAARTDPHWETLKSGLGAVAEQREIHLSSGKGNLNSLFQSRPEMFGRFEGLKFAGVERIAIERLDAVLDARKTPLDAPIFIKSDTQGGDLDVLRGAGSRLRQTVGILLEMSVQPLYEGTPSHWEILEFARAAGFEPYAFSTVNRDDRGALIEYDALLARRLDG
jgi:FkbM family methyltransferase